MPTPEAAVKASIKNVLEQRHLLAAGIKECNWPDPVMGWYYMPVQSGLGVHGIPDFVGNYRGLFFAIEAKAPGKTDDTSPNQKRRLKELDAAKAYWMVTDTAGDVHLFLNALDEFMNARSPE